MAISTDGRTWHRKRDPALDGPRDQVIFRAANPKLGQIAGGSAAHYSAGGDLDAAVWTIELGE